MQLVHRFNELDVNDQGYLEKKDIIAEVQKSGHASSYDQARETLKDVHVDASGRMELEDFVEVC